MKTQFFGFIVFFGISFTLAVGGKATGDDLNLANDFVLDHFDISLSLASPVIVNTPFPITITARDASENIVTDYSGEIELMLNLAPFTGILPSNVTLTNGIWQGDVTITRAEYGFVIIARGGGKEGRSDSFDVLYPGPYSNVSGQVLLNGRPFLSNSHVHVGLFDYEAWYYYPTPRSCYNRADGTFFIPNVRSGTYGVSIKTDNDTPPNYCPFPGDFWGHSSQFAVVAPMLAMQNCAVHQIVHLKSPADNRPPGIPHPPPYPFHFSPVTFSWDPIPAARAYNITIVKAQDDPYQHLGVAHSMSGITTTRKTISLPRNASNQHYEFSLVALGRFGEVVGELLITLTNPEGGIYGHSDNYRFKVPRWLWIGPIIRFPR